MEFKSTTFKQPQSAQKQPALRRWDVGAEQQDATQTQQPPVLTDDDIAFMQKQEAAIKAARKEKATGVIRMSEPAKQRIELLANIGRMTRDVEIGEHTFTLRTLKAKETREAALASFKVETQLEAGYEVRKQQLARSLHKIDGGDIAVVLGDDDLSSRLSFIEEHLEEAVVSKLFEEFSLLKEEANKKCGIHTETEAKEVVEDLKK